MRYLFFDVEGANCYNFVSKMCTFGYVITDTDFKVLSKIDVIMNPGSVFDKHILRKKMNAYPVETYLTRPPFNYFYKSIKNILEEKDQIVIGWSIDNDVKYVYDACKRYNLKQIKYKYIDLQKVIMLIEKLDNPPSLESICEQYNIPTRISHKSDDDAFLTMKIAKLICNQLNISIIELFDRYPSATSSVDDYESHLLTDEEIKVRINRRKIASLITNKRIINKTRNNNISSDNVFAFSINVIDKHSKNLKEIIKHIYASGAKCTTNFKEANVITCDSKSLTHYKNHYENDNVKVLSYKQLKELTGIFSKQK